MAVFVENNSAAVECIRDNLKCTKLSEDAVVMQKDVYAAIQQLESEGKCFDIVFMDPPYDCFHEKKVLERLLSSSVIHKETLIVVEASLSTDFSYAESYGYTELREKIYKTNKHIFLRIK